MNDENIVGLSPIQELSDLDLSFINSQLSSVSGEITERTIEELLRDAESQPPSLSWCRELILRSQVVEKAPNLSDSDKKEEHLNLEPITKAVVSSNNVFKSAIDSLSEISNKVQEKLSLEDNCRTKPPLPNSPPIEENNTYRCNKTSVTRDKAPKLKTKNSGPNIYKNYKLSNRPIVQAKVDTRWTTRSSGSSQTSQTAKALPMKMPDASYSRKSVISAAVKLYGNNKISNAKQKTIKETLKPAKVGISPKKTESLHEVEDTRCCEGTMKHERTKASQVVHSDFCNKAAPDSDILRKLWKENAQLNLQIKNIQAQLCGQENDAKTDRKEMQNKNSFVTSEDVRDAQREQHSMIALKTKGPTDTQKAAKSSREPDDTLSWHILYFEKEIAEIKETYQAQLDKLSRKCETLEKLQLTLLEKKPIFNDADPLNSCAINEDSTKHDIAVQTVAEVGKTENIPANCQRNKETKTSLQEKRSKINFALDDLVLDSNFVPWQESVKNDQPEMPRLDLHTKSSDRRTTNVINNGKNASTIGSQEVRRLQNTIRSLRSELDVERKVTQRLRSQQASVKAWGTARGKTKIRRTMGTQTIGLAACNPEPYNPALFQAPENISTENAALKKSVTILEEEVRNLKQKRLVDLRLLQKKHEEEIEILLDEKMALSKKLEALPSWRSW